MGKVRLEVGQLIFSVHTQAPWPPAPGPFISWNSSHIGQVGAAGKADLFIAPLIS